MTSWRVVLRERQLAIDAADREVLEAKEKHKFTSTSEECVDDDICYGDMKNPELSSPSTADAVAVFFRNNVSNSQLISSDNLQDSCECNISPVHEMSAACSSGVENEATDQDIATSDYDLIEVIKQSSPAAVGTSDELKFDTNCTADAESVGSVDFTASDQISSSVTDSPSCHQQQTAESLSSTPEHLVSDSNVLNCISDYSEVNSAGDLPQMLNEVSTFVESSLDIQSPEHKRTRRHAQKRDGRKKHRKVVQKAENKLSDDAVKLTAKVEIESNDHCLNTSDDQSQSEHWNFDTFQSSLFDKVQHSDVVPDATVTDDFAMQVVRQPSYLKAVGIPHENAVTSQQQNNYSIVAEPAITQASKDHLSSRASDKTGSEWVVLFITSTK